MVIKYRRPRELVCTALTLWRGNHMAKRRGRRGREARKGPGTLIRGADGALYFLPDDKLEQFVVEERVATAVQKLLGPELLQVQLIPGKRLKKSGVIILSERKTISVVSIGATRQRK